jgi:hypothetical protein
MPQPYVAIQVEGVLRRSITGAPLESGKRLYHSLALHYQIVMVTEETDRDHVKGWLGMEGMSKHAHVVYGDSHVPPRAETRWLGIARLLRVTYGYDLEYLVLCDPHEARVLIELGYSVMLVHNAAYADPGWRPDASKGIQPWDELVEEITSQRAARAADKRTEEDPLR